MPEQRLRLREAAQYLGISRQYLSQLARDGRVEFIAEANGRAYTVSGLDRFNAVPRRRGFPKGRKRDGQRGKAIPAEASTGDPAASEGVPRWKTEYPCEFLPLEGVPRSEKSQDSP